MKISLFLLVTFLLNKLYAQNLVSNPSFEDTLTCPLAQGEISNANGWSSFGGTPDLFNSCNTYPANNLANGCSVPSNYAGFQSASSGSGYAGIITLNLFNGSSLIKEYIGCHLNSTLTIGTKYYFSMMVSPGHSIPDPQISYECFSNNLGIRFTTNEFSQANPTPTNNFSHIHESDVLTDTINWTPISGTFIADSNYNYLSIGNFYDDENTIYLCDTELVYSRAYYFIDDVCLSNDSTTCFNFTSLSDVIGKKSVEIWPIPAHDVINISGPSLQLLKIINLVGEICYIQKFEGSSLNHRVNVSALPRGSYFTMFETNDGVLLEKVILY